MRPYSPSSSPLHPVLLYRRSISSSFAAPVRLLRTDAFLLLFSPSSRSFSSRPSPPSSSNRKNNGGAANHTNNHRTNATMSFEEWTAQNPTPTPTPAPSPPTPKPSPTPPRTPAQPPSDGGNRNGPVPITFVSRSSPAAAATDATSAPASSSASPTKSAFSYTPVSSSFSSSPSSVPPRPPVSDTDLWSPSTIVSCSSSSSTSPPPRSSSSSSKYSTPYNPNYRKTITLMASEVPTLAGLNPYRSLVDVFEQVWKRTEPHRYERALHAAQLRLGRPILNREQQLTAHIEHTPVAPLLNTLVSRTGHASYGSDDLRSAHREIKTAVRESLSHLSEPQQREIASQLTSTVNQQYGLRQESAAITHIESVTKVSVEDNNRHFYSMKLGTITLRSGGATSDGSGSESGSVPLTRDWGVGGKVDGFQDKQLVEIKNRTHAFKNPLPLYDRAQFETYLQILGLQQGTLIERIKPSGEQWGAVGGGGMRRGAAGAGAGAGGGGVGVLGGGSGGYDSYLSSAGVLPSDQLRHHVILRDDRVWQERLFPALQSVAEWLAHFLEEEERMTHYMQQLTEADKLAVLAPIVPTPVSIGGRGGGGNRNRG